MIQFVWKQYDKIKKHNSFMFLFDRKTRYTNDYKRELSKPLVGTTVKQLTDTFKVPYSTGERFIKQHLAHLIPSIQRKVIAAAQDQLGSY